MSLDIETDEEQARIQREWELGQAYQAALTLQHRLELAGLDDAAQVARLLRDEVTRAFHATATNVDIVVDGPPCQEFHSDDSGSSS